MATELTRAATVEAHVAQWCQRPMAWGVDDCMLAVADVVRDITGHDPARKYRGRYKTPSGARRVLGAGGALAIVKAQARARHWRRVDPAKAKPGDVGLTRLAIERPGRPSFIVLAAMVCRAPGWWVGRNEYGFTALPPRNIVMAWSIA